MKKIVSNAVIVGSQLLVGGLFLVMLFTGKPENNMVVVVENSNMNKMADVVSSLFVANTQAVDETVVEELKSEEEIKKEEELKRQEELRKQEEEAKAKEEAEKAKAEEEAKKEQSNNNNNVVSNHDTSNSAVLATYYGSLTGYGPDCYGCSGYTSSGHNANASYTYNDSQYGTIRIVAADPSIPLYSVFRITMPGSDPFLAIVLDRGGNVGFDRGTLFDLLFPTEAQAMAKTDNVMFEQLR